MKPPGYGCCSRPTGSRRRSATRRGSRTRSRRTGGRRRALTPDGAGPWLEALPTDPADLVTAGGACGSPSWPGCSTSTRGSGAFCCCGWCWPSLRTGSSRARSSATRRWRNLHAIDRALTLIGHGGSWLPIVRCKQQLSKICSGPTPVRRPTGRRARDTKTMDELWETAGRNHPGGDGLLLGPPRPADRALTPPGVPGHR